MFEESSVRAFDEFNSETMPRKIRSCFRPIEFMDRATAIGNVERPMSPEQRLRLAVILSGIAEGDTEFQESSDFEDLCRMAKVDSRLMLKLSVEQAKTVLRGFSNAEREGERPNAAA